MIYLAESPAAARNNCNCFCEDCCLKEFKIVDVLLSIKDKYEYKAIFITMLEFSIFATCCETKFCLIVLFFKTNNSVLFVAIIEFNILFETEYVKILCNNNKMLASVILENNVFEFSCACLNASIMFAIKSIKIANAPFFCSNAILTSCFDIVKSKFCCETLLSFLNN